MQKLKDISIAILIEIFGLLTIPFLPLIAILGYKYNTYVRTSNIKTEDGELLLVPRWFLPKWLWWFQTPDELMPGAMYEPTVVNWLKFGQIYTATLWMLRNRVYGLSWTFGRPASGYLDPVNGKVVTAENLWRFSTTFGPFYFGCGWKVHRKDFDAHWQTGPFWAIPFITIRIK